MKLRITSIAILLAVSIFLLNSCSKGSSGNTTTPVTVPKGTYSASVAISNFAFSPNKVYVLTGGAVTWTNKDAVDHTATDLNGAFDSGHINPSQTFKFTFTKAGTYTYHCLIHSSMANATVVVSDN
ncbi:MAG TPA: cupredoxin domain-containing protein [Mucilaginibacter sp.]|nr:cupredoxin domain-containing protein [Mucilaginibacter sp.]